MQRSFMGLLGKITDFIKYQLSDGESHIQGVRLLMLDIVNIMSAKNNDNITES